MTTDGLLTMRKHVTHQYNNRGWIERAWWQTVHTDDKTDCEITVGGVGIHHPEINCVSQFHW